VTGDGRLTGTAGPGATAVPAGTRRRVLGLVTVAVIVAIVAGLAWWRAAESPRLLAGPVASWQTILGSDAPHVAGPMPAVATAEDRDELDEVVALQATRTPDQDAAILAWSSGDVVERWDRELMDLVRDDRLNPVRASRAYALLNVAIYDAVVTVARLADSARPAPADRDGRIAVVDGAAEEDASAMVAAAGAAERVLSYLFPGRRDRFEAIADEAAQSCLWAGTGTRSEVDVARAIGQQVGEQVVARAMGDGSAVVWRGSIPITDHTWQPLPGQPRPLEPLAGTWRPWLLDDGAELRPGPQPEVGSAEFERDAAELVQIRRDLTPADVEEARFWADGGGTVTPSGHWLLIALDLTRDANLGLAQTAQVAVYVALAQADAFIACWDAKYAYWSARPVQLIDGFASAIPTPSFPAYPSGHSTQSRAAATVLAEMFPAQSDEILAMAVAAGESRILGGIHWRADHVAGAELGAAIGRRAIERMRAGESLG